MIRKIIIACICLTSVGVYAQNSTVSPYSYFGIGDLKATGTVENQMMGGLSVYADSIHLNLNNPAAYSKLRLTTYTAGLSRKEFSLVGNTSKDNASVSNLDYLALGFSLGKGFGLGFGIMPYSSVGYNFRSDRTVPGQGEVQEIFTGKGGLNRVYASLGYQVLKDFSIGATANFNFGTQNTNSMQTVEGLQFGSFDRVSSRINGFDFNFSANFNPTIKQKYTLFTSVIVNTQANLVSRNTRSIGSFSIANGSDMEVIEVDLEGRGLARTGVQVPTTTTLGVGFGEDKKWFLGTEYSFQELSNFRNELSPASNLEYKNAGTFRFGGFYIPDYASFTNYFKRVVYRAGARISKSGIVVDDREINDFGITFGLGLPLGQGINFSNVNIGFELGRRGTKYGDLVEENYFKINLGLSLSDIEWFQKRKIN